MKRLGCIMILVILFSAFDLSANSKMRIEGGLIFDWGNVEKKDMPLKHKFKIYNDGQDTLRIYSVKPSCGCTTAPLDREKIEPGGFAILDVTLNLNNKGKVTKTIRISTNDPDNRQTTLSLKANILIPLSVFPTYLGFGKAKVGRDAVAKVILTNSTDQDITIKNVKTELIEIIVNLKDDQIIPAHSDFTIEAVLRPVEKGRIRGNLKFQTTHEDVPFMRISIWGDVIQ